MSGRTHDQSPVRSSPARMTRSRVKSMILGESQPVRVVTPKVNGVSVKEKEEPAALEETAALEELSATLQPALLLSSPTRSRLLVSIPMGDTKRKLNNTSDQPHNSPQKHRRLSQGQDQLSPPHSPHQSDDLSIPPQAELDQQQYGDAEGSRADTTATVPYQSQPGQKEQSQKAQESTHSVSTSQDEDIDKALSRESVTSQTLGQDNEAAENPSLSVGGRTEHGDDSRTTLGGPDDTILGGPDDTSLGGPGDTSLGGPDDTSLGGPGDTSLGGPDDTSLGGPDDTTLDGPDDTDNAEDTWGTQHRRKRARTNEKAEGDGIQDDDDEASDPEEDEENQVVPEYVLREMQAFEQGFNGLQGKFKLMDKIGAGTFSSVYKAIDLEHDQYDNAAWDYEMGRIPGTEDANGTAPATTKLSDSEGGKVVALKRIYVTSSPDRIENEIAILHDLSGHKNVVPLITAFRFMDQVIVVLPYFEHRDFREYYKTLPMDGIRCYFRALLKALLHVHSQNIIHRDVKPSNFLYDVERKTGMLVDFGLAQRQEDSRKTYRESYSRSSSSRTTAAERPPSSTSRHAALERASTPASTAPSAPRLSTTTSATTLPARTLATTLPARTSAATLPVRTSVTRSSAIPPTATAATTARAFLTQRSGTTRHDKENSAPMNARSMLESRATPRTAYTPTAVSATPIHPAATSYVSRSTVPNLAHNPSHSTRHQTTTRDFAATLQNPFQRQRPGVPIGNASASANLSPILAHTSQGRPKHNSLAPHSEALQMPVVGPVSRSTRPLGFNKRDPRPVIRVNRAGTRGFRAPEILFRHVQQTVALDIWSVGVILLCFLSGRFPFFHSDDDLEALLEIAVVFGQREMAAVAATFNRTFVTTIPAIKDYGVSRARICRLLNPTRFGKPDNRSSRSLRSSWTPDYLQGSSTRNSQAHGSAVPLQAHNPTTGTNIDKQVALPQAGSRSRNHNDLLTRGQDRKESPATAAPALSETHPEGEVKAAHQDSKSHPSSKTKDAENINFLDIEDAYKSQNDIIGTEKEEDFADAISLLEKLLTLDPTKRITAKQALKHRFLAEDKP